MATNSKLSMAITHLAAVEKHLKTLVGGFKTIGLEALARKIANQTELISEALRWVAEEDRKQSTAHAINLESAETYMNQWTKVQLRTCLTGAIQEIKDRRP